MRRVFIPVLLLVLTGSVCLGQSRIAKRALRGDGAEMQERLLNRSFEDTGDDGLASTWTFWDQGYARAMGVARTGDASARCVAADEDTQYGADQVATLDQAEPMPIVVGGWSKAEDVSGSPNAGYSVYVDLFYTDGTPLYGQINYFETGTHDWQYRQVVIVPEKPIREVTVHALFRFHTGTVYFDDFSIKELAMGDGARLFDGVPVTPGDPAPSDVDLAPAQLLLRDVAAGSDFLEAAGECPELGLELTAEWTEIGDAFRLEGQVKDLTGEDRCVAVYVVIPVDFTGGVFGMDARRASSIDQAVTYSNTKQIGAGTNGRMSWYPIAPVSKGDEGLCIATPLDVPRVSRLAYDAGSKELYAAFDLGLTAATTKFPSSASFSAVIYPFDAEWGFRAALAKYYELFPGLFTKRVEREGIWMPFADIATVQDSADFGFMFKEGNNNVGWDEAHGIYTFVYVEPMSHWLPMVQDVPRTPDGVMGELARRTPTDPQSQATATSVFHREDGTHEMYITDAPWCDGAMLTLNCDPDLLADQPDAVTQAKHEFATITRAFQRADGATTSAWRDFESGHEVVEDVVRTGARALRCANTPGDSHGAAQTILVGQTEPQELVASVWAKADGITGQLGNDCSLYLDLTFTDGSVGFGRLTPIALGTYDWRETEVRLNEDKPIQTVNYHLLLRNGNGGTAWFDDAFLGEPGGDNLLAEAGFEPSDGLVRAAELDGTYIDSYEMAATTQNHRREHWAYLDIPLTFGLNSREVCSLGIFHTYEFAQELERRMHGDGKLTFANAVLSNFGHPAHLLDVMGTETNWQFNGEYLPNSDAAMNYRRALCYQKPYVLLLNSDYTTFKPKWVELYFKRCAAYAIFPSFFSHNAADDPYWQNPALYNRDRPLFVKFIPVIKALAAAGWEPITYARADHESVYVERFGTDAGQGIYVTLFNDSQDVADYSLSIDGDSLGLAGRVELLDVLTGSAQVLSVDGAVPAIEGELESQDVRVLKLTGQ